ncbi:MAG: MFS transporter [Pseudomonadota bacterium]
MAAGAVGTGLEFYDLTVYGLMAATLAPLFFPSDNTTASLIATFAAFSVGLIARIAGGFLFGWIADRFGRRISLIGSVTLMAASCGLMAILPTFQAIGLAAPVLIVALRICQGLAVGGELGISYVFVGEHAPTKHRALALSSVGAGTTLGILLGALVVAVLHLALTDEQVSNYGWRIAFGLGVGVALVGFLIRSRLQVAVQTPRSSRISWRDLSGLLGRMVLNVIALSGIASCYFTLYFFAPNWTIAAFDEDAETVHLVVAIAGVITMLATVLGGWVCDRFGSRPTIWLCCAALAISFVLLPTLLSNVPGWLQLFAIAALAIVVGFYIASIASLTFTTYPPTVRGLGCALAFNLGYGLIGGTAPMIALWLNQVAGIPSAFIWYPAGLCLISIAAVLLLPYGSDYT